MIKVQKSVIYDSCLAIVPTQQFTEEEIQNLHEIFKLFDKNDNGFIEASDLKNIMDTLNRDPT